MRTSTTSRRADHLQSLLSVFRLITILSLIFVNFQPNTRVSANSRAGYVEKVSTIQSSLLQTSFDFENNDPQGWVFSRNDPAQTSFLGVVSESHLSFQKPSGWGTGWWTYRYDIGSNKTNSSARFKCTFKHNGNFFAQLIVKYRDGTQTVVFNDSGNQGPYPKQIDKELSASKEIASIEFGGNMYQGGSWIDNVVIEGLQSTRSEILVDKNTAIANNEDPIQVTVAARDSNGDLLIGHSIRLDVSGSENTILGTNPATTDQAGLVNFTFTSKRAESKILSVVDLTTNVSLNTNQEVVFLAGPVDGSVSKVELGTGHEGAFPADGTSVPVTVTALDAYSNAVSGSTVTISVSPSNQINLIQPTLQTDTDGKAVGSISSMVRQSVTINAEIDTVTVTQPQPVTAIFGGVNLRLNISAQAKTNQGTSSTKATAGYPIAYSFQVTNTGPMSANGVTLVDHLPQGLSYQSGSTGCNATGQIVTCQVGTLTSGQNREFEITALIDPEVALVGYITNVATIQGDEATQSVEESPDNNTAELVTRVEPPISILRIEPDISVLEVQPGETTTRQIKIYNSGLEDCQSITLTLPAHLSSWVSLNPSTITELGSGESAEVTLAAHPGAGNAYGQHLGLLKAVDDLGKEAQLWLAVRVTNPTHAVEVTILNSQDSLVSGAVLKVSRNSSIYTRVDLDGTSTNYIPTQSSISNTEGKIVWENLEEGTYDYELSANYHEPLSGTLIVDSAGVHPTPAFRLTAISGLYLESWQSLMSVVAGKQVEQVFTVRNTGAAPLTELGIELNSINGSELPGWVALSLPNPFPELGAGNSLTFSLTAQPGTTILPGIYPVSLKIRAGEAQIEEAAVDIWVSSSSTRDVRFMVLDAEITDPQTNQPSAVRGGGRIILTRLRPEITSEGIQFQPQYSQAIDEQGQSLFTTLEIGEKYSYQVWAPHYLYEEGQLIVQATSAGEQVSAGGGKLAKLMMEPSDAQLQFVEVNPDHFTYTWKVIEGVDTLSYRIEVTINNPDGSIVTQRPPWCIESLGCSHSSDGTIIVGGGSGGGGWFGWLDIAPIPKYRMVELRLSQTMILDWQSFTGSLVLENTAGANLENVHMSVVIKDEAGNLKNDQFVIQAAGQPEGVPDVTFGSPIVAGEKVGQDWKILPKANVSTTTRYWVQAKIDYTINGKATHFVSLPAGIEVDPAPHLDVTYEVPAPDAACVEFDITTTVKNTGNGTARNVSFAQNTLELRPLDGLGAIQAEIVETRIDDQPATQSMYLNLGTLNSGDEAHIYWRLKVSEPVTIVNVTGLLWQENKVNQKLGAVATIHVKLVPGACKARPVPRESTRDSGDKNKNGTCSSTSYADGQENLGDPINVRTGGVDYSTTDLSLKTLAGNFAFTRWYATEAIDSVSEPFSAGWTHNQIVALKLPQSDPGVAWVKLNSTNEYAFFFENGEFKPSPGLFASLEKQEDTYFLTDCFQRVYAFDLQGKVKSVIDSQGHGLIYEYDDAGRLTKVHDNNPEASKQRWIQLAYDVDASTNPDGKLRKVWDHAGREVEYAYGMNGDLQYVYDVLDQKWVYTYDGTSHRLTSVGVEVTTASGTVVQLVERTEYDNQGRALRQFNGNGELVVALDYTVKGQTTARDSLGNETVYQFAPDGTLIGVTDAAEGISGKAYNSGNFRQTNLSNPAGHELQMVWSADGVNLMEVTDPEGNKTSKSYDGLNNLTQVVDPMQHETDYVYEGRLLTSTTNALEQTTSYTYTEEGELNAAGDPQPGGLLKTETDALDRTTTYAYDAFGQKISVTDDQNRTTRYAYDDLGRLIDTIDPQGVVTHNEYNDAGWLVRVTRNYVLGRPKNDENLYNLVTEYEYDAFGHQTLVRDTLNRTTKYEYDKSGRLVKTTNALNQTTTNIYDANGVLVETIDALQNKTTYRKDEIGRSVGTLDPYGHGSTNTFDVANNKTITTDALGNQTVTFYDKNNRVVKVVDPLLGETLTTYDANGNVVTRTDVLGRVTYYEYDALNRVVRQTQNYHSNPPQTEQHLYNLITEYSYDEAGNQVQVKDPEGHITYNEYDEYGRLERQTHNYDPDLPKNHQGQYNIVTEYGYDAYGRQNRVTDTYGRVTLSVYDRLGRLLSQTQNYDASRAKNAENQYNLVTEYHYDALGNQTQVIDPTGQITYNEYDALNRLIKQTRNYDSVRPKNDLNEYNIVTEYRYDAVGRQYQVIDTYGRVTYNEYDNAGRVIRTTRNYDASRDPNEEDLYNIFTAYEYDAAGHLVKEVDTYGRVTFYEYDAFERKKSKTENFASNPPENAENEYNLLTRYTYDLAGRQTDEIDPNGIVTHFEYDALSRLAASVQNYQAGVNPTEKVNVRIEYTYDAQGHRLSRKDPRGNSTTYTYDALGRLASETTPLGHNLIYTYDALGNLSKKTDGNSKVINYSYDALGRPTLIDLPAGEVDITFTYTVQGQRLTMTDGQGTTHWTYDSLGRVASVTNPNGSKVKYTYDALGNCLTVTTHLNAADVTGKRVTYAYDALGRKISVTDWQGQPTTYEYDATGRLREVQRPNGVLSAYTYNSAGRLVTLVHSKSEANLAVYEYRYDAAGNRTYAKEKINAPHILFLPIILKEEGGDTGTLALEGTLEEDQPIPLDEPGDPNLDAYPAPLPVEGEEGVEVQSLEPVSLLDTGYPAPGETPSPTPPAMVILNPGEVEINYTYDAINRMTSAVYTDGTAFSYTYDAAGNTLQLVKTIGGQTSTVAYSYDADNQIATSRENNGTVWQYQFDGNGSLIETRPGSQVGNGARRYSYNSAGQLTKVETHNGTSYQPQAEMVYNGLGQRLGLTAYEAGQSLNTSYILDGDALLAATANGQSTYYVPGLAEYKSAWNYYLSDGQQTVRQITDGQGMVLLTRRFTPWGELLDQTGNGKLTWGYLGGVLDAATGLIYVGNGQYYDPATGRFLSRGANPGAPNPYVPWQGNPLGMILGPLALLVLVRGKRKGGKIDQFLVILIVALAVSLTVSSCTPGDDGTPTPPPSMPPSSPTEPRPTQPGGSPTPTQPPPTETPEAPNGCYPITSQPNLRTDIIIFGGSYGQDRIRAQGPGVMEQLLIWTTDQNGVPITDENLIRYPGYEERSDGTSIAGKARQQEDAYGKAPCESVILIGYSAGTESALMYARWRLEHGQPVRAVVLLGPTFGSYNETGMGAILYFGETQSINGEPDLMYDDWADYISLLLKNNVDVLIWGDNGVPPDQAISAKAYESSYRDISATGSLTGVYHYESTSMGHIGVNGTNNSLEAKKYVYDWIDNPYTINGR